MFRRYLHSTHIHTYCTQDKPGTYISMLGCFFVKETKQSKNCIVEAHKIYFLPVFTKTKKKTLN